MKLKIEHFVIFVIAAVLVAWFVFKPMSLSNTLDAYPNGLTNYECYMTGSPLAPYTDATPCLTQMLAACRAYSAYLNYVGCTDIKSDCYSITQSYSGGACPSGCTIYRQYAFDIYVPPCGDYGCGNSVWACQVMHNAGAFADFNTSKYYSCPDTFINDKCGGHCAGDTVGTWNEATKTCDYATDDNNNNNNNNNPPGGGSNLVTGDAINTPKADTTTSSSVTASFNNFVQSVISWIKSVLGI